MRWSFPAVAASVAALGALAVVACNGAPTTPADAPRESVQTTRTTDATRREALTRQMALALADADFRADVAASLASSPVAEQKVHFQRWSNGRETRLRQLGRSAAQSTEAVQAAVLAAPMLELYFPVPGHRERWNGGTDVLVATTGADHEAPVAFTLAGERRVLDATTPPDVPVLALVPMETDFDAAPRRGSLTEGEQPPADGGSGGGTSPSPYPTLREPGLWVRQTQYRENFEGWLKGAPEFDIHILGKAGGKDSMTSVSCTGRAASGAYWMNQTSKTWSGEALLYTNTQLDQYKAAYPDQGLRILVVEDDDGACVLKVDGDEARRTIEQIELLWPQVTGGLDKLGGLSRLFERYKATRNLVRAIASIFTTRDDLVGNAVDRTVTGEWAPFGNWIVKGPNAITNGYLHLEMR